MLTIGTARWKQRCHTKGEESHSSKQAKCLPSRPFCQCQDHPRRGMGKDASLRDQEEEGQQPSDVKQWLKALPRESKE